MKATDRLKFSVKGLDRSTRLDRVVREQYPEWTRRGVQALINGKKIRVNGRVVWICSWKVKNGDQVEIAAGPKSTKSEKIEFDRSWVIANQSDLIAVIKPEGLLSHATKSERTNNLLTMMTEAFGPLSLFHRLDRDTSGVVLFTYNGSVNRYLDTAFKEGTVEKEYLAVALTPNNLETHGKIDARLDRHPKRRERMTVVPKGGQKALTRYVVVAEAEGLQLLRLWPETGRTHQLRVHLAHMAAPILGDPLYGPPDSKVPRLFLHARAITLPEEDGFPKRRFAAPIPDSFISSLPDALATAAQELD